MSRYEGQRIYLRSLAESDTDTVLCWRGDPGVANQLFSARPPTRSEHEAWLATLGDTRVEFVIVVREGEQPVGTIGLSWTDRDRGEVEYGILIGEPEWRGRGIAREASELILKYAFEEMNADQVILRLFADNAPALALYERLGFAPDPALSGVREKNGVLRPVTGMRLGRMQWKGRA